MSGNPDSHARPPSPLVILVHGVASTPATWDAVAAALAPDFECLCPAMPGHGSSRPVDFTFDSLVEDLESLRASTGRERVCLVGHSLGAFVVAAYAARFRAHVAAIGLLAAPVHRTAEDRAAGAALLQSMREEGVEPTVARLVGAWYTPDFLRRHPDAVARRLTEIRSIDEAAFLRAYGLYTEADLGWWLPYVVAPGLVITGENARGCPGESAIGAAAALRAGEAIVLEGQRNGILTEVPGLVAAHLREFLNGALATL